ncbi:MAG: hypothetical protein U9N52_05270 [Campylobacterota bacterium]|nr:hypothetical protein [Campylobacterota bacterium]
MIQEIIFLALGLRFLSDARLERERVTAKLDNCFKSGTNIGSSL